MEFTCNYMTDILDINVKILRHLVWLDYRVSQDSSCPNVYKLLSVYSNRDSTSDLAYICDRPDLFKDTTKISVAKCLKYNSVRVYQQSRGSTSIFGLMRLVTSNAPDIFRQEIKNDQTKYQIMHLVFGDSTSFPNNIEIFEICRSISREDSEAIYKQFIDAVYWQLYDRNKIWNPEMLGHLAGLNIIDDGLDIINEQNPLLIQQLISVS